MNATPTHPPDLTPYEWAIVGVLRAVRRDFVAPRLKRWAKKVNTDPRLAANLRSAFGNLRLAKPAGFAQCPEEADLATLLEDHGHTLFSSYVYCAVTTFGERSLVPVAIGAREPDSSEPSREAFERRIGYLQHLTLPYHIEWDELPAYGAQILPCTGGTAPSFYRFVREDWDRYRTFCKERDISPVPAEVAGHWLGRLALLHKAVDYRAGHLSAVFATVAPTDHSKTRDYPTIVLTSIVPQAFYKKDRDVLSDILRGEYAGSVLLDSPAYEGLYATPRVWIDSKCDVPNSSIEKRANDDDLRRLIKNPDQEGIIGYRARFWSRSLPSTEPACLLESTVVNASALYRLLPRLFPQGPVLDRRLVCTPDKLSIDLQRLGDLAGFWHALLKHDAAAYDPPTLLTQVWNVLFRPALSRDAPLTLDEMRQHVRVVNFGPWILACFSATGDDGEHAALDAFVRELRIHLDPSEPESHKKLSEFNHRWREHDLNPGAAPRQANDWVDSLIATLRAFLKESTAVQALLVLEESRLAIPEGSASAQDFYAASYPIYWLFESAVREMCLSSSAERDFTLAGDRMPFEYITNTRRSEGFPAVALALPEGDSKIRYRRAMISGVNFIGMPLRELRLQASGAMATIFRHGKRSPHLEFDLDPDDPTNALHELRREWLRIAVQSPNDLPCIRSAIAQTTGVDVPTQIKIHAGKYHVHHLTFASRQCASVVWRFVPSYRVTFLALGKPAILKSMATAASASTAIVLERLAGSEGSAGGHVTASTGRAGLPDVRVIPWADKSPRAADIDMAAAEALSGRLRTSHHDLLRSRFLDAYSVAHPLKHRLAPIQAAVDDILSRDGDSLPEEAHEALRRLRSYIELALDFSNIVTVLYQTQKHGADELLKHPRFAESKPFDGVLATIEQLAKPMYARRVDIRKRLHVTRSTESTWMVRPYFRCGDGKHVRPAGFLYAALFDEFLHNALQHGKPDPAVTDGREIVRLDLSVESMDDEHMIVFSNRPLRETPFPKSWTPWSLNVQPTGGGTGLQFASTLLGSVGFGGIYCRTTESAKGASVNFGLRLKGLEKVR